MNTNDDLASWGEPPTETYEESLADQLDMALQQLEKGEPLPVPAFPASPDSTISLTGDLLQALSSVHGSTTTFRRHAGLLDDRRDRGTDKPDSVKPTGSTVPDPFPGEFRLLSVLGEGAFGKVWLAEELMLRRQVALKTLALSRAPGDLEQKLGALQNEAGILGRFSHPHIVQVYAWRQSGPDHYLVLQLVPGGSLLDRLKANGPLPWHLAARYVADVGDGLVEVHGKGIVHRDIKPANILWHAERDEALLTDFGISALQTGPRSVAGTPFYMAPEAFEGHLSPAMDVYSLAATLFHLVTGDVPFPAATTAELPQRIRQGLKAVDARCEGMPEPLEQVIRAGLAADPTRRPTPQQFVNALRGTLNQLLADSLPLPVAAIPNPGRVKLHLTVSREVGPNHYQPVAATQATVGKLTRNMKKVPRPPENVRLRSGERVRVEVVADQTGYVTVFNIGPTGDFNLLYPDEPLPAATPPTIQAGAPLHVIDVEMQPPAGRERLCAVWSRRPLTPEQAQGILPGGTAPSGPYQASRNMVRVKQAVQQLPPDEWQAVVLELDHGI